MKLVGKLIHKYLDNTKIDLKKIVRGVGWVHLGQDRGLG
jgi:hypothetical protein